ncbi:MAG TPA: LPS assembly protein LptD [Verrucomicrobiae bacterium]|jgi:LPS-assembly protein|nr:LPS assembly protein LptD [Verrucomicrobiae bacterium]
MTCRTRLLITALFLCHQLLASALVTRQLLPTKSISEGGSSPDETAREGQNPSVDVCGKRAAAQLSDGTIICATNESKQGDTYDLQGDAEIHYRSYILRADHITYNSDTGESTGTGHMTLDGGTYDEHVRADHGSYNLTAETGRFYEVTATVGAHLRRAQMVLTSTSPFAFTGKFVEKISSDRYLVYDGSITTCQLPHPDWQFRARELKVEVGANASVTNSRFFLLGFPIFYFPYGSVPIDLEARKTGFLLPSAGESSIKGTVIGDAFFWAINRSADALVGAEYYSKRGWAQHGEFRARPTDTSWVDLNYFGVIDRGTEIGTATGPQVLNEGGEEARLNGVGDFYGFRAVSNVDYLSSFLFRLTFSEIFTQAVNSEVKSQLFLAKSSNGYFLSGMAERYQDFFQLAASNGTLTNPPVFDAVQIWHSPSADFASVDRPLAHTPLLWSFDTSVSGLSRSEPGFHTSSLLGRFTLTPEMSLPLHFGEWSLRPAIALHEGYYTQRFVDSQASNDPTNRKALETSVELRPPIVEKVFDRTFLGRKWKHVMEPRAVYRYVTGVNNFANILHFDERDILSNTNEVEYGLVTRLYAKRTNGSLQIEECETPMTGLAVGAAAPEQNVPWQKTNPLGKQACPVKPPVSEVLTWELAQKYFIDPTFGGALIPGQRNVFTTTEELTGIAFATEPRHLSPLVSRLRAATGSHTDTEWDLDYDFQLGRINASTLLVNYNIGKVTLGGGDAFLQIPQTTTNPASIPPEGTCNPVTSSNQQVTCKFQQFRVALGYGGLNQRGFSAAGSMGFDAELQQLQFSTIQTTYNWDCCGLTLEYRRYSIGDVRNENLFRFSFTLGNIGSFGNLRRYERLY